jgi:pimeloyl-ACP methyl ester carboxylesterase
VANELSALTEIASDAIDRYGITPAEMLHAGVARRVFTLIGVASTPTRLIHDRLAATAYSFSRAAVSGAAGAMATTLRTASGNTDVRPLSRSRSGRTAIGALNALSGDRLAERRNDLTIRMAVRNAGVDVACTRDDLARAFPAATTRVAVFVHGLAETDEWWLRPQRGGRPRRPRHFGARLHEDAGYTPVYLRYNTGLHVSENGEQLDELLETVVAAWPVPVRKLALIGHSMGGLLIRSAAYAGTVAGHRWPSTTRNMITLGTPHHGAPLAKAAHAAAWALHALPEATPIAQLLDTRSAGIRDLRLGALHDDDWRDERFDTFADRRRQIPLLPGCKYTFITATVTHEPTHPMGRLLGDFLVRTESAGGRCRERTVPVDPEAVVHLGGLTHFNLLQHPQVYEVLRRAISAPTGA